MWRVKTFIGEAEVEGAVVAVFAFIVLKAAARDLRGQAIARPNVTNIHGALIGVVAIGRRKAAIRHHRVDTAIVDAGVVGAHLTIVAAVIGFAAIHDGRRLALIIHTGVGGARQGIVAIGVRNAAVSEVDRLTAVVGAEVQRAFIAIVTVQHVRAASGRRGVHTRPKVTDVRRTRHPVVAITVRGATLSNRLGSALIAHAGVGRAGVAVITGAVILTAPLGQRMAAGPFKAPVHRAFDPVIAIGEPVAAERVIVRRIRADIVRAKVGRAVVHVIAIAAVKTAPHDGGR